MDRPAHRVVPGRLAAGSLGSVHAPLWGVALRGHHFWPERDGEAGDAARAEPGPGDRRGLPASRRRHRQLLAAAPPRTRRSLVYAPEGMSPIDGGTLRSRRVWRNRTPGGQSWPASPLRIGAESGAPDDPPGRGGALLQRSRPSRCCATSGTVDPGRAVAQPAPRRHPTGDRGPRPGGSLERDSAELKETDRRDPLRLRGVDTRAGGPRIVRGVGAHRRPGRPGAPPRPARRDHQVPHDLGMISSASRRG